MPLQPRPFVEQLAVYEPGRPLEEVARSFGFADVSGLIKLASNENLLGPSPRALDAMRASAAKMHLYPDGGCHYLRQELAARLGVEPANLVFGAGSNEIIEFLGHVFLGPGANIVMASQAFLVYRLVAAAFEAKVVDVPMRNHAHDLDAMLRAITPQTRLVFVANPNNPTGTMVAPAALDAFLDALPDHVLAVVDEAYIELVDPAAQPELISRVRAGHNLILLRTFSKAHGLAGLRVGYGIAPAPVVAWLEKFRQPFNVCAMAQDAALAALADEEHLVRTRALVRDGLAYFEEGFRRLGLDYVPSVANFILVKTGRGREVFQQMQRLGIIVRPVDAYGLPDYVRITTGTAAHNEACLRALEQVLGLTGAKP